MDNRNRPTSSPMDLMIYFRRKEYWKDKIVTSQWRNLADIILIK